MRGKTHLEKFAQITKTLNFLPIKCPYKKTLIENLIISPPGDAQEQFPIQKWKMIWGINFVILAYLQINTVNNHSNITDLTCHIDV